MDASQTFLKNISGVFIMEYKDVARTKNVHSARQSNFEFLRIVAMLMIVASHLAVHGVQHVLEPAAKYAAYATGSFWNKAFVCFLLPGGEIGVALFFMITGYFLCSAKRISVRRTVFEAAFYSILTGMLFVLVLAVDGLKVPIWGGV